jgi:hypothetical protein
MSNTQKQRVMKKHQLFNGIWIDEETGLIFKARTLEDIAIWLTVEIQDENEELLNKLRLSQAFSCTAEVHDGKVQISGDEDFKILDIKNIKVIDC